MPSVPETYKDHRRSQILGAARECFQRNGFHQTTMRHVADEAGLSPGTLYLYFDGKEDLIRVLSGSGRAAEDVLLRPLEETEDPLEAFEEVVAGFLDAYREEDNAKAGRLLVRYWGEALGSPELLADLRARREHHISRAVSRIAEAQDRGRVDAAPPARAVAHVFLGLITTALLERSLDPAFDLDSYRSAALSLLHGTLVQSEEGR